MRVLRATFSSSIARRICLQKWIICSFVGPGTIESRLTCGPQIKHLPVATHFCGDRATKTEQGTGEHYRVTHHEVTASLSQFLSCYGGSTPQSRFLLSAHHSFKGLLHALAVPWISGTTLKLATVDARKSLCQAGEPVTRHQGQGCCSAFAYLL
jgi:hypothetical protein